MSSVNLPIAGASTLFLKHLTGLRSYGALGLRRSSLLTVRTTAYVDIPGTHYNAVVNTLSFITHARKIPQTLFQVQHHNHPVTVYDLPLGGEELSLLVLWSLLPVALAGEPHIAVTPQQYPKVPGTGTVLQPGAKRPPEHTHLAYTKVPSARTQVGRVLLAQGLEQCTRMHKHHYVSRYRVNCMETPLLTVTLTSTRQYTINVHVHDRSRTSSSRSRATPDHLDGASALERLHTILLDTVHRKARFRREPLCEPLQHVAPTTASDTRICIS